MFLRADTGRAMDSERCDGSPASRVNRTGKDKV